jgi:regulator of protease activity HflC (stomatin/prohibitin superfamily)
MRALLLGLAIAVGLLLVVFIRANLRRLTVFEYERGLRYTRGRFVSLMEPGQYWIWALTTAVRKVDMRLRVVPVAGQEVLSADGVAIKASLAATYRIVDPARAVNAVESYEAALYTALQLALRAVVASRPAEEVLEHRASLGPEILRQAATPIRELGLELLEADLKDLTLPGELKKIFAQVVRARQEGLAALEKARRETAALRNLANAAHMIERNPHLMQLRLLQVLGERSGNTVVLGVPGGAGPIPVRGAEQPPTLPDVSEGTEPSA